MKALLIATAMLLLLIAARRPLWAQGPEGTPAASPTPDRLASPTTIGNTQPDRGAELYWLHCQPCHGDQAQGLTDEWRAQYPPEDQNCWESGCHGRSPYENGFVLPTAVPALIGEGSLARFGSIGQVYEYASAAMPYQDPGHLTDEEYLAITAFLARGHGLWNGTPLTAENAAGLLLPAGQPAPSSPEPAATPGSTPGPTQERASPGGWPLVAALAGAAIIAGAWLWRRRRI
jgi:cytochrome c